MKTIHLLRHAKSSWDSPELVDHDRPLAKRGRKDAEALAAQLAIAPIAVDVVLCSTALRARETLEPLRAGLGRDVRIRFASDLFHASPETILGLLRALPKRVDHVLVVGHSPGLDALVGRLAEHGDHALRDALTQRLPTCTLVTLTAPIDRFEDLAPGSATLIAARRAGHAPTAVVERRRPHAAVKAGAVKLTRGTRWGDAADAVLTASRAHFEANLEGAEDGDAESIHQLRVAMRRARVLLLVFGDVFDPAERNALRLDLRWLARKLGPLREAQVFAEDVLGKMRRDAPRTGALTALAAAADAEIVGQLHEARASIRGPRGRRTIARLRTIAITAHGHVASRAKARAKKRLERRLERVLEHTGEAAVDDPIERHELRKALKKLRYAAEFLGSLFDVDAVHRYVDALSHLQDVLGALQDESVGRTLAHDLLERHHGGERAERAVALVDAHLRARSAHDRTSLVSAIARLSASEPFWR